MLHPENDAEYVDLFGDRNASGLARGVPVARLRVAAINALLFCMAVQCSAKKTKFGGAVWKRCRDPCQLPEFLSKTLALADSSPSNIDWYDEVMTA